MQASTLDEIMDTNTDNNTTNFFPNDASEYLTMMKEINDETTVRFLKSIENELELINYYYFKNFGEKDFEVIMEEVSLIMIICSVQQRELNKILKSKITFPEEELKKFRKETLQKDAWIRISMLTIYHNIGGVFGNRWNIRGEEIQKGVNELLLTLYSFREKKPPFHLQVV